MIPGTFDALPIQATDHEIQAAYNASRGIASLREPEWDLMSAILEDAWSILSEATEHKNAPIIHETRSWFMSSDQDYVFSFINICSYLNIDPGAARKKLREMPNLPEHPPRHYGRTRGRGKKQLTKDAA